LRRQAHLRESRVPRPGAQCRDNQFFSARDRKFRAEVRRGRCVPASAVRCIPRARLRPGRGLSELVRGFHLRDQFVRAAVLVRQRAGPASATFHAV